MAKNCFFTKTLPPPLFYNPGPEGNFDHEKIEGISEIQTLITGVRVQYGTIGGIYTL